MNIAQFAVITVARLKATTPPYFKILRTYFMWAFGVATSIATLAKTDPNVVAALNLVHLGVICQYISAISGFSVIMSSLPAVNPVAVDPETVKPVKSDTPITVTTKPLA